MSAILGVFNLGWIKRLCDKYDSLIALIKCEAKLGLFHWRKLLRRLLDGASSNHLGIFHLLLTSRHWWATWRCSCFTYTLLWFSILVLEIAKYYSFFYRQFGKLGSLSLLRYAVINLTLSLYKKCFRIQIKTLDEVVSHLFQILAYKSLIFLSPGIFFFSF